MPDKKLDHASVILSSMGLPLSPPSSLHLRTEGLSSQSTLSLHHSHDLAFVRTAPGTLSTTLDNSELDEKPPHHSTISVCKSILVPSRPALYASIIRLLLSYPKNCATTKVLRSNLSELIGYDLLELEDGYMDTNDDEAVVAIGLAQRLVDATQDALQWGTDGVWRPGEE